MPDNSSKLQNVQLTGEPSDGLRAGVVKTDSLAGGAIGNSLVSGATEQNIEGCGGDCKTPITCAHVGLCRNYALKYCDSRATKRNLP